MRIVVIGASGNTGSAVAKQALDDGHDLRVVVRNPESCLELAKKGAQLELCDLDDPDGVTSAVNGAEAIYYCSPLPVGYDEPFTIERSRGRNVINAAQSAGVKHFVLLSAKGPEAAPGVVLLETKRAIESELAASGLGYTILRPSMFMDNVAMAGPEALLSIGLTWPFSESALIQPVAATDIGKVAFRAIMSGPRNESVDLVGPEVLTFSQMAKELGGALGADVRFIEVSDEVFVEHVGAAMGSKQVAQAITETYRLWERDGSGTGDASILEQEFDMTLVRFHDYAADLVKAWKRERLL